MSGSDSMRPATILVIFLVVGLPASLHCTTGRRVAQIMQVKVYFSNAEREVCTCDVPVVREIPKTGNAERAAWLALEELIEGPTEEEYAKGYRGCLPSGGTIAGYKESYMKIVEAYGEHNGSIDRFGRKFLSPEAEFTPWGDRVRVKGVRIRDGTAYPDFSKELYSYGGGSCFTEAIETGIVNTLIQFTQVQEVVILIEGREAEIEP